MKCIGYGACQIRARQRRGSNDRQGNPCQYEFDEVLHKHVLGECHRPEGPLPKSQEEKMELESKPVPCICPRCMIPDYWDLKIETLEELKFLGKVVIKELVRYWHDTHASRLAGRNKLLTLHQFFIGRDAANIVEYAKQFENPDFPKIGVPKDSWSKDPEPMDADSINRKGDATTFNVCGWCKHASGGTGRFGYNVTTCCGIEYSAGIKDKESYRFNTPCFLKTAPDEVLKKILNGLDAASDTEAERAEQAYRNYEFLKKIVDGVETKPALPAHRDFAWFNLGDKVVCWTRNWHGEKYGKVSEKIFLTAKVVNGYRHHDGCVSVIYDEKLHTNDEYFDGCGGGYGMSRPEVMHQWEFEYLRAHPDFAEVWSSKGVGRHLRDFDSTEFLKDLKDVTL